MIENALLVRVAVALWQSTIWQSTIWQLTIGPAVMLVQALAAISYDARMNLRNLPSCFSSGFASVCFRRTLRVAFLSVLSVLSVLLLGILPVQAADLTGLYDAKVTVTSRDNERERARGFGLAMQQMLVRLTGRTDVTDNPQVTRAVAAAQPYVESWVYRTVAVQDTASPEQITLEVTFFQSAIQQLLSDANIAIWPPNRPDTVLWVVVQDELGERFVAGTATGGNELLEQVRSFAGLRGLPLLLPLQDFEDQRALRPEQAWNLDVEALRNASARYQSDSILALRIYRSLSGEVIGKAVYLFRDGVLEHEALETPLPQFLQESIDLATRELVGYYAISLNGIDNSSEVILTVDNITGMSDYAALLHYLQELANVSAVQVLAAEKGSVQLQLRTGGQFRQLIESMALDRKLSPAGEVSRNNQQILMHYQWRGL